MGGTISREGAYHSLAPEDMDFLFEPTITTRKRSPILKLPVELTEHIASFMKLADLASFRHTCRAINNGTIDTFSTHFIHLPVLVAEESLETLIAISKSHFADKVRSLTINLVSDATTMPHYHSRQHMLQIDMMDRVMTYIGRDQEYRETGLPGLKLQNALQNLRNCTRIQIITGCNGLAKQRVWQSYFINFTPGSKRNQSIREVEAWIGKGRTKWEDVYSALQDILDARDQGYLILDTLQLTIHEYIAPVNGNLKVRNGHLTGLRIKSLSALEALIPASLDCTHENWIPALEALLSTIANLQELTLRCSAGHIWTLNEQACLFDHLRKHPPHLPSLTKLKLQGCNLHKTTFFPFIQTISPALTSLTLARCTTDKCSVQELFEAISSRTGLTHFAINWLGALLAGEARIAQLTFSPTTWPGLRWRSEREWEYNGNDVEGCLQEMAGRATDPLAAGNFLWPSRFFPETYEGRV